MNADAREIHLAIIFQERNERRVFYNRFHRVWVFIRNFFLVNWGHELYLLNYHYQLDVVYKMRYLNFSLFYNSKDSTADVVVVGRKLIFFSSFTFLCFRRKKIGLLSGREK